MDPRPMYRHAEANPLRRAIRRSAGWKPFSWFYARTLHLIDRAVFRLTRGRATFTSWLADLPVAWLTTTTGAKSGVERTSPVLAIPAGEGKLVVIASNYRQRNNPSWYHNCARTHGRASSSTAPSARWPHANSRATSANAGTSAASRSIPAGSSTERGRRGAYRSSSLRASDDRDCGFAFSQRTVTRRPRYRVILPECGDCG
jgi:hypothetical protein